MPVEDNSKEGIVQKGHHEPLGMNIANKDILKSLTDIFDPKDSKVRQTEMPDVLSKTADLKPEASKDLPKLEQEKSNNRNDAVSRTGRDKGEGHVR
ncbi:MAG: hypothetical protein K0R98_1310 [Rickettsiaceae bacterium]|jgi:hypothetical protein|nr:hypothetical protein [Rickettsiaceae bacterium]